jgi:hypothetical protein
VSDETETDDEIIECWCGAKGTREQLFDASGLEYGCGGTGVLHCFCGGDLCVCHFHGESECPGCEDCEGDDLDDFDDSDWDSDE